jgi:hypothetical protein
MDYIVSLVTKWVTHNNTISTSDSHHICIRIDRDGSSDK